MGYRISSSLRATTERSRTNASVSISRVASSGARRIEEGCTVAVTAGASGESTKIPRCFVTRKLGPRSAWAAVAPEAHEDLRLDQAQLRIQPRPAGGDLLEIRLLVDPALASRLPVEVFHDVRDVHLVAVDAGLVQRPVEQLAGRADERPPLDVLPIARLFADEYDLRLGGALAEDRLGCPLPEVATAAGTRGVPKGSQGSPPGRKSAADRSSLTRRPTSFPLPR